MPSIRHCVFSRIAAIVTLLPVASVCSAQVVGRCCVGRDHCELLAQDQCLQLGGSFGGPGSPCSEIGALRVFARTLPTPLPIENGSPTLPRLTIDSQLVSASVTIHDIDVGILAPYTWQGDLVFRLQSPTGTDATFINRPGAPQQFFGFSADNFGDPTTGALMILDDEAPSGVRYDVPAVAQPGMANVSGRWLPDPGPLSVFDGETTAGVWTLTIESWAAGDFGTLNQWSLLVTSVVESCACADTLTGDCNCDGAIDNFDIDPFVLAVIDAVAYGTVYPSCERVCAADLDFNSHVDNFDIDPFIACLSNLPAPGQPCPPP